MKDSWTQLPYEVRNPPLDGNRTIDARRTPRTPGVQTSGVHTDNKLEESSEGGTLNEAEILERMCSNSTLVTPEVLG